jgi:hypothetical protein
MAKFFYLAGIALVSLTLPSTLLAECGPAGCFQAVAPSFDCGGGAFSGTGVYYGSGSPDRLTEPPPGRALLILGVLDPNAEVYVDGVLTGTIGLRRHYVTPPLKENTIYVYTIKIIHPLAVEEEGQLLFDAELWAEEELKVPVIAGNVTKVRAGVVEAKLVIEFAPNEEALKLRIKPAGPPVDAPDPDDLKKDLEEDLKEDFDGKDVKVMRKN